MSFESTRTNLNVFRAGAALVGTLATGVAVAPSALAASKQAHNSLPASATEDCKPDEFGTISYSVTNPEPTDEYVYIEVTPPHVTADNTVDKLDDTLQPSTGPDTKDPNYEADDPYESSLQGFEGATDYVGSKITVTEWNNDTYDPNTDDGGPVYNNEDPDLTYSFTLCENGLTGPVPQDTDPGDDDDPTPTSTSSPTSGNPSTPTAGKGKTTTPSPTGSTSSSPVAQSGKPGKAGTKPVVKVTHVPATTLGEGVKANSIALKRAGLKDGNDFVYFGKNDKYGNPELTSFSPTHLSSKIGALTVVGYALPGKGKHGVRTQILVPASANLPVNSKVNSIFEIIAPAPTAKHSAKAV